MKKNLNINLSGELFNIDEDAYLVLEQYLQSMQQHFQRNDLETDIMVDFEARISELLLEQSVSKGRIVDLEQVKQVIQRMGQPQEIFSDDQSIEVVDGAETSSISTPQKELSAEVEQVEPESALSDQDQSVEATALSEEEGTRHTKESDSENGATTMEDKLKFTYTRRKLYRDPINGVLGGVIAGLANRLNWSILSLRLLVILITIFGGVFFNISGLSILLVYVIVWIILPPARTATERLEMYGKPVNVATIGEVSMTELIDRVELGRKRQRRIQDTLLHGFYYLILAPTVVALFTVFFHYVTWFRYPVSFLGGSPYNSVVLSSVSLSCFYGFLVILFLVDLLFYKREQASSIVQRTILVVLTLLMLISLSLFTSYVMQMIHLGIDF